MKTNLKFIATLLTAGLLAFSARAFVVLQDNFNYPNGALTNSTWVAGAGNLLNLGVAVTNNTAYISELGSSAPRAYFTNGLPGFIITNEIWAGVSNNAINNGTNAYYFGTNEPVAALYFTYSLNVSTATNSYHAALCDTNFTYVARIYASTNTAGSGNFRVGIGTSATLSALTNHSGVPTNIIQQDLNFGGSYTIVARYLPASGLETLWVNPANEAVTGSSARADNTYTAPWPQVAGFVLRSATGTSSESGDMTINSLVVGTAFTDVVPSSAGQNPPFITAQPQSNTSLFIGNNFTNSVVAGGDPAAYQWYFQSNSVVTLLLNQTNATLPLNNVATNQSGLYYVTLTNLAAAVTSSVATILISPTPVPPGITSPTATVNQTNIAGDTVNLTVTATGVPAPSYQWKTIVGGVTNLVGASIGGTTNITGTNGATLTFTGVTAGEAGTYFATVTNLVGKTNSPLFNLVVNPIPFVGISTLVTNTEDPNTYAITNTISLFTVEGIVTTWTNMTTAGSSEFYIQDASAGITIFWDNAPASTNLPPAGAIVKVTGPMGQFDGLPELEPVFGNALESVVVLSTNNPLPAAQPLPFDPAVVNNPIEMQQLVGSYFVASNVLLDLADGPTFGSGNNDPLTNVANHVYSDSSSAYLIPMTNSAGQTFIIYYNTHTDIPGQTKPTGPVTVYGVLGQFVGNPPYVGGYEFTPSRFADIISYYHATNVLSDVTHYGDLLTNTFTETALRPGETLTTYVSVGDPVGGTVTLLPNPAGLPASASWSGLTAGQTATGVFTFSPLAGDAGSNYVINFGASSTSGAIFSNVFTVYVPTSDEQQMAITEFLANPATNTSAPDFNPLHRPTDTQGPATNDEFIELINLSGSTVTYGWDVDTGITANKLYDSLAGNNGNGTQLAPHSAFVIYSGDTSETPSLPVPSDVATSSSLGLPTSGTGVLDLRNPDGYLIDRVVYSGGCLPTNSSMTRFPTADGPFVPQAYVGTNAATAGLQYDGKAWTAPSQIPTGVNNIKVTTTNNLVALKFTAVPNQASTLWSASSVLSPFSVIYGQTFGSSTGVFSVTNCLVPQQYYYITTQTNGP